MYTFMLKKHNSSYNLFMPYMETVIDPNGDESKVEWGTEDLTELAEKYKELLKDYTTTEIKVIEELDAEILVEVVDN